VYRMVPVFFNDEKGNTSRIKFVALFIPAFFAFSLSVGETFFWITSTAMYLWALIALCFGLSAMLRAQTSVASMLICFSSFLFVGGSAEAVSLPALMILAGITLWRISEKKDVKLTVFSFLVLLISVA